VKRQVVILLFYNLSLSIATLFAWKIVFQGRQVSRYIYWIRWMLPKLIHNRLWCVETNMKPLCYQVSSFFLQAHLIVFNFHCGRIHACKIQPTNMLVSFINTAKSSLKKVIKIIWGYYVNFNWYMWKPLMLSFTFIDTTNITQRRKSVLKTGCKGSDYVI